MYKLLCDLKNEFFLSQSNSAGERQFLTPTQFRRAFLRFHSEYNEAGANFPEVSRETIRRYYSEYIKRPFATGVEAQRVPLTIDLEPQLYDALVAQCDKNGISIEAFVRQLLCVSIDDNVQPALKAGETDGLFDYFICEIEVCPSVHKKNMCFEDFSYAIENFAERANDEGEYFQPLSHANVRQYFKMYTTHLKRTFNARE